MAKGIQGETCSEAIRAVLKPGEIVPFSELFGRIKQRGDWKNSTIWQHLMSLVVNLPPARYHWPNAKPFLFLRADGGYELYKESGYESSRDKILEALESQSNGYCNECLEVVSGVSPGEHFQQIYKVLLEGGHTETTEGECRNCRRNRSLVRLKKRIEFSVAEPKPEQRGPELKPNRSLTTGELIDVHLRLGVLLDRVDVNKQMREGFSARVIRLKEANLLPGNVACMMLTINGLRNMVVHEGFRVGGNEEAVIHNALTIINSWSKSL